MLSFTWIQLFAYILYFKYISYILIIGNDEYYAQVGNGDIDHSVWGRASELTTSRPCYKVDSTHPGSDVAGEAAAALAASSIVFKEKDKAYSNILLQHAKGLYTFAKKYQGKYSDSIPDAAKYYRSWSGYNDELIWSAAWLYKATKDEMYKTDAMDPNKMSDSSEVSWDNKFASAKILLANLTGNQKYTSKANDFCKGIVQNKGRTKEGMVFINKWGSTRYAANIAFACMVLTKYIPGVNYNVFGKQQIDLLLGDAGRSFVVDFGKNPPQYPHHSGSSCSNDTSVTCNWDAFKSPKPNPSILEGALVGGPKSEAGLSSYVDKRDDYISNEVAIDYNAGFQSAVAALLSLHGKSC